MTPRLELITTGAELLDGRVVNRHAAWLGAQLAAVGWELTRDTTVSDDATAIHDAVVGAASRAEVVILTGGLGPTTDDVTRDVVAAWAGSRVVMHEPTRQTVIASYQQRNKPLNETVERHALVVDGAVVLANRHGLAPGEHLQVGDRHVFLLPGPPREFQGVMNDHLLPWLTATGAARLARVVAFQTAGLGESDIAARLAGTPFPGLPVDAAYCAEPGRVSIRLREQEGYADALDQATATVRSVLGEWIYAETDITMEQVVADLLIAGGQTMAVAESCTGGLLGQRLTEIPGSSRFFRGGVIAYHNDVKRDLLDVPADLLATHGAVSEPVARAMAHGVRQRLGADWGVAITGVAGPDGGTTEKPVGLVYIACYGAAGCSTAMLRLGGGRGVIRESAATLVLDLLRRALRKS